MFNNAPFGFVLCAVVMTFFPGIAVKVNKGVRTGTKSVLAAYAAWQLKRSLRKASKPEGQ